VGDYRALEVRMRRCVGLVRVPVSEEQTEYEPLVEATATGDPAEEPAPYPPIEVVEDREQIGAEVWLLWCPTLHDFSSS
jgi:hypothetical protein